MTTPVPVRFSDEELATIDDLVNGGVADNRSAVIRRAVQFLAESVQRAKVGASIADSYRRLPQSVADDELAMANAMAMTDAESW